MNRWILASSLGLALSSSLALGSSIGPGSPAPAMDVKEWFKGTPVTTFDPNKLYVVEFWATWCGPCKESIPHLTELAAKNPDVSFVGISIWEDDKGGNIKQFVDDMGAKMNYNVGYSGNQTGMAASWMAAAGQNGIPTAFVIEHDKIEWVGHPMELEKPLADIKAGTFDEKAFATKFAKDQQLMEARKVAYAELKKDEDLYKSGKKSEAEADLNALAKKNPELAANIDIVKLGWMATDNVAKWRKTIVAYSKSKNEGQIDAVCQFALGQTQPGGNIELGKEAIETVLAGSKTTGFYPLYFATVFYRQTKDYSRALQCCNQTIAVLPHSQFKSNKEVADDLNKMQTELTKLTTASR